MKDGPFPVVRSAQPVTSEVFDTYWKFAYERQEVYFRRLQGRSSPWTTDPIIRLHRFTNAYRAADRVSQYLIRNVIYADGLRSAKDVLLRILIFKFFNRIDTWELLNRSLGGIRWSTYSFTDCDRLLTRAIDSGKRIYSPAYIMPACSALGAGRKHRGHLRLIEKMIVDGVAERLEGATNLAEVFAILQTYPMMGDFLAFQYTIDLNYSELTNFSEFEFVVPGPGARDGLRKIFCDPGGYSEPDLIRWIAERQEKEFDRLRLPFRSLWGRRLQLIDCQNLLCEVDKYARVRHPDVVGVSGRTRIKQRYEPGEPSIPPWFPPKWGLNAKIHSAVDNVSVKTIQRNLFVPIP
ncbi:MAG: putative DNA base hypermodification protein [Planctomycetota bacterium]|nr:putative DNA base hypermodification protein [Planctomycetota bacterium]